MQFIISEIRQIFLLIPKYAIVRNQKNTIMKQSNTVQSLDHTHVDQVPRDKLFRLLEPLTINGEVAGQTGEYVLIPNSDKLPFQTRLLFDELRERMPQAAYITLRTRNLITLVYIAQNLHDGSGEAFTSGNTQTTPGAKANIVPSPITAEAVRPTHSKAGELPKDQPIVLAASYQCIDFNGTKRLLHIEDDDVPTFDGPMGMMMESLFLRKGSSFILVKQDKQLILRKWGNKKDCIAIDPDCELEVCITENKKER